MNTITELLERLHELGRPLRDLQAQLNAQPEGRTLPSLVSVQPRRQPAPTVTINITVIQENPHDHQDD